MKFYKSGLTNLKRNKMNYIARGCMYCEGICNKECLPKQETVEDAAENNWDKINSQYKNGLNPYAHKIGFIEGSEWMQERMYSEEDLRKAFIAGGNSQIEEDDDYGTEYDAYMEDWFNQFKKK